MYSLDTDRLTRSHILIVDDNKDDLLRLENILQGDGYTTSTMKIHEFTPHATNQLMPDLILIGLTLPQLQRLEAYKQIKANKRIGSIPIIYNNAQGAFTDKTMDLDVGGDDYISKPYDPNEVRALVKSHLSIKYYKERMERANQELKKEVERRKAAEIQLYSEKERLRITMQSLEYGIIYTDKNCKITLLNEAAKNLSVWLDDTAIGKSFETVFQMIDEHTHKPGNDAGKSVFEKRDAVGVVNHTILISKNGEEKAIEGSVAPIMDMAGNITGSVWTVSDATEKHRSEILLQESNERFRSIYEQASVGICNVGRDGRIIAANDKFCNIMGYSRDEMLALMVYEITHPEDSEKSQELISNLFEGRTEALSLNKRYIQKGGNIIWANTTVSAIKDTTGKPVSLLAVVQDITEKKIADEKLIQSEGRLRQAQAIALVGNWERDLENGASWLSDESIEIFGLVNGYSTMPPEECARVIDAEDMPKLDEAYRQLLENNGKYDVVFKIKRETDAAERYIQSCAILEYGCDGKPRKVLGVNQDVTELLQAQGNLRKTLSIFSSTLQSTVDAILVADLTGKIIFQNDNLLHFFNVPADSADQLDITKLNDIICLQASPDQSPLDYLKIDRSPDSMRSFDLYMIDGRVYRVQAHPQLSGEKIVGRVWRFHDITERRKSEEALVESERQFRCAIEQAPTPIMLYAQDGEVLAISKAWTEITGYTKEEIPTIDMWLAKAHGKKKRAAKKVINRIIEQNKATVPGDFLITTKNGQERVWSFCSTTLGRMKDGRMFVMSIATDVTEQNKRMQEIAYLNFHDKLTGIYNRPYFDEEMHSLNGKRQLPISVIMGDVNGLKLINDGFGHMAGDKLLVEIAKILKSVCHREDIIARTGGDEFCILLPNTDNEGAHEICQRIYAACEKFDSKAEGEWLHLSISLGFATKTLPSEPLESTLYMAEENMSKHKLLERRSRNNSLLASIRTTMNEKSNATQEHEERLAVLSRKIGKEMALSDKEMDELELLSTLHDIGKISVPDSILSKPGKLTSEEWDIIKKHPEVGYRIALASPELVSIAEGILCHHERWDGNGYPQGIIGDRIPLLARIVSVVDSYDAMISDRVYRKALSHQDAINEIARCSSTQFDPAVVDAFLKQAL